MPNVIVPDNLAELGYTEDEWKALSRSKRWALRNPEKMKAATDNWRNNNKEYNTARQRQYQLKSKYGITEDDYTVLLTEQDGKCAICMTDKPTGKWKVFAVDHCHNTGKVRGLLCNECNRGIGLLKDSPELLQAAKDYLEKNSD